MKKLLKYLGVFLGLVLVFLVVFAWIKNEPLPKGRQGQEADELARKMLTALNYKAYEDTRYLEWSFQGGANEYVWDKKLGSVKVSWKDYTVHLDLVNNSKGTAKQKGVEIMGSQKTKLIEKARDYFNNDSFWLVAPYKVFDKGTKRSLVALEDGTNGLLVTYESGGSTPGDSYLWRLNPNGFPNSYKMWVQIIPIGGLEASWDDWMVSESGAFLPKSHSLGPISLDMGNVRGYN